MSLHRSIGNGTKKCLFSSATRSRATSLFLSLSLTHIFIPIFVVCPPRFCSTFLKSTDNNILMYYITHVLLRMKQATRAIQSAPEEKLHSEKKRLVVLLFVRIARPDCIRGFDVFAKGTRPGREEPRRVI